MKYDAEEQYREMLRAYKTLKTIAENCGKSVEMGDHVAADAAKAFFIACYHFKDWLKKDPRITHPNDVESFITAHRALSLAADLCNAFKHAGLDKAPRSGAHLDQINMAYSLDIPTGGSGKLKMLRNPSDGDSFRISRSNRIGNPIATAKVVLTIGGTKYEALDLATTCIKEWETFLAQRGLLFSKK